LKLKKTQYVNKVTTKKQVGSSILKVGTTVVAMDNHMAVIQV
jgi:S-adenosylmethionine:tRNA-ribosyltransferase-isomerase (queuine synthetase)